MSEKEPEIKKLTDEELLEQAKKLEVDIEKSSAGLDDLKNKILGALEKDKKSEPKAGSGKKSPTKPTAKTKAKDDNPTQKREAIPESVREEANKFLDKITEGAPLYFNQTKETRIVQSITTNKSGVRTFNLDDGSSHNDKELFYARTVGKVGFGLDKKSVNKKTASKNEDKDIKPENVLDLGNGIKIMAGQEYADTDKPSFKYEIVKVKDGKVSYRAGKSKTPIVMGEEDTRKFFESNPNIKLVGQTWEVAKSKKTQEPDPETKSDDASIDGSISMTNEGASARVAGLAVGDVLYGVEKDEYANIVNIETKGKGKKKKKIYTLEKRANGEVMTYSANELADMFRLGKVAIDSNSEDIGKIEKPEIDIGAIKNKINDLEIGAVVKGRDSGDEYTLIRVITDKNGNKIFEFENNKTGEKRSESEREMVNALKGDAFEIISTTGIQESKDQKPEDILKGDESNEESAKDLNLKDTPKEQDKLEKEISPSENLNASRDAYMKAYEDMLVERQDIMKGKRNWFKRQWVKFTGEKVSKEDLPEDNAKLIAYEQAKKDYENAKVGYGNYLYEKKKEDLVRGKLSEENKAKALALYKSGELFKKLILDEGDILEKAKIEALPKREQGVLLKALQWYGTVQPRYKRIALSIAIGTGIAAFSAGSLAALGGAAVGVGARVVGGALAGEAGIGIKSLFFSQKKIDKRFEKNKKTLGEGTGEGEFSEEWLKAQEDRFGAELKKKKKLEKVNRYINAGIRMGSSIGAGLMAGHFAAENAHEGTGNGPIVDHTPPPEPEIETINPLATVRPGDGVEHLFIRQIEADPDLARSMGWDGSSSLHTFAQGEAHRLAISTGYFNHGTELRLGYDTIGHSSYVITEMPDGSFGVREFIDGKLIETHSAGSPFEATPDDTEYIYRGTKSGGTLEAEPNVADSVDSGSGQMGGSEASVESIGQNQMGASGLDNTPLVSGKAIDLNTNTGSQMGGSSGVVDSSVPDANTPDAPDASVDASAPEAPEVTPDQLSIEVQQNTTDFINKYLDNGPVDGVNTRTWEIWKNYPSSSIYETDELGHISHLINFDGNYQDASGNIIETASKANTAAINKMLDDIEKLANKFGIPPANGQGLEDYIEVLKKAEIQNAK